MTTNDLSRKEIKANIESYGLWIPFKHRGRWWYIALPDEGERMIFGPFASEDRAVADASEAESVIG